MTCLELLAQVSEYLDETLVEEHRLTLEGHLGDCERCVVLLETVRSTILVYRGAPGPGLDPARRAELLRRLERACRGED